MSYKILILGANGMIGHKIYQKLSLEFDNVYALMKNEHKIIEYSFIKKDKLIYINNAENFFELKNIFNTIKPDIIINAIGITIRRSININIEKIISINSLLPRFLENWAYDNNKKLIHFSTDCVFSGKIGNYTESSIPDSLDIYGKTKGLGEVCGKNTLTIRSSMIGPELTYHTELFDWLISQNNSTISGYNNVIYSGISTIQMSEYITHIIKNNMSMSGIYNISSEPISKYNLLKLLIDKMKLDIVIKEDQSFSSNKNLISYKFFQETNLKLLNWNELSDKLITDYKFNKNIYK